MRVRALAGLLGVVAASAVLRRYAYALAAGLVLFGLGRYGDYLADGFWRAGLA